MSVFPTVLAAFFGPPLKSRSLPHFRCGVARRGLALVPGQWDGTASRFHRRGYLGCDLQIGSGVIARIAGRVRICDGAGDPCPVPYSVKIDARFLPIAGVVLCIICACNADDVVQFRLQLLDVLVGFVELSRQLASRPVA